MPNFKILAQAVSDILGLCGAFGTRTVGHRRVRLSHWSAGIPSGLSLVDADKCGRACAKTGLI